MSIEYDVYRVGSEPVIQQKRKVVWDHPQNEVISEQLKAVKRTSELPVSKHEFSWKDCTIPYCEILSPVLPVYGLLLYFKEQNFESVSNREKISEYRPHCSPAVIEAHDGSVLCSGTCFLLSPYKTKNKTKNKANQTLYFATARHNIAPFLKLGSGYDPTFFVLERIEITHPCCNHTLILTPVDEEETVTVKEVQKDISFLKLELNNAHPNITLKFEFNKGFFIPREMSTCSPFLTPREYYNIALHSFPSILREVDLKSFSESIGRKITAEEEIRLRKYMGIGSSLMVRSFGTFVDVHTFPNTNVKYIRYKAASVPGCSGGPVICFPCNEDPFHLPYDFFYSEPNVIPFDGVHRGCTDGLNVATSVEGVKTKYEKQVYAHIKDFLPTKVKKQIENFLDT
ncbi:hypothetical protein ABK040_005326 [Willaertia magna]